MRICLRKLEFQLQVHHGTSGWLRWAGVGNVEAFVLRAGAERLERESLMLRGGVVGSALPRLFERSLEWRAGDVLLMTTDGIAPGCTTGLRTFDLLTMTADAILEGFATGRDDALVLLARCGVAA